MKPTTVYLLQVGQERENGLVAERNKNDTVVRQCREGGINSHFLPSTRSAGGNENTGILASEGPASPETTGGIPEGLQRIGRSAHDTLSMRHGSHLPLGGEGTISGRDTEEEGIVFVEVARSERGIIRLGRGVKFGQDFGAESLSDPRGHARFRKGWKSRMKGAYWKIWAEPPACSTPVFTLSATVGGRCER